MIDVSKRNGNGRMPATKMKRIHIIDDRGGWTVLLPDLKAQAPRKPLSALRQARAHVVLELLHELGGVARVEAEGELFEKAQWGPGLSASQCDVALDDLAAASKVSIEASKNGVVARVIE